MALACVWHKRRQVLQVPGYRENTKACLLSLLSARLFSLLSARLFCGCPSKRPHGCGSRRDCLGLSWGCSLLSRPLSLGRGKPVFNCTQLCSGGPVPSGHAQAVPTALAGLRLTPHRGSVGGRGALGRPHFLSKASKGCETQAGTVTCVFQMRLPRSPAGEHQKQPGAWPSSSRSATPLPRACRRPRGPLLSRDAASPPPGRA